MVSSYKEQFRQLFKLGIAALIIVVLVNFLSSPLVINKDFMNNFTEIRTEVIKYTFAVSMTLVIVITVKAFSFLNKRKSSDIYHSLPVKRTALYGSVLAAAVTWIAISVFLPQVIFFLNLSRYGIGINEIMGVIALWISAGLYMLSLTTLCMAGSGNNVQGLIASLVLIFAPRIAIEIFKAVFESALNLQESPFNGITSYYGRLNLLDDEFCVGANLFEVLDKIEYNRDSTKSLYGLVFSVPLTAVYLLLGRFVFKKRKSEMAATVEMNKVLKRVFQVMLLAVPCVMVAGIPVTLDEGDKITPILLYAVGLVVIFAIYFITETERRYDKACIAKMFKRLPILVCALILLMGSTYAGMNFAKKQKISSERTKYIYFEGSNLDDITSLEKMIDGNLKYKIQRQIDNDKIIDFFGKAKENKKTKNRIDISYYNGGYIYSTYTYIDEIGAEELAGLLYEEGYFEVDEKIYNSFIIDNEDYQASKEIISILISEIKDKNLMDYLIVQKDENCRDTLKAIRADDNGGYYLDLSEGCEFSASDILRFHIDNTLPNTIEAIEKYLEVEND